MTITTMSPADEAEAPGAETGPPATPVHPLVESARSDRDRIAAQALVDEETILSQANVRAILLVEEDGTTVCRWEGLMGRVYGLGLDHPQRAFIGLVLSVVGIGHITLAVVPDLDERRMLIVQRMILQLTGNDRVAIGTRV